MDSEEVIFYFDVITDFIKKKSLLKAIKLFIEEKSSYNTANSYGFIIFQDDKNPITIYDKKNTKEILDELDVSLTTRELNQSYLENGLFEILSYIFSKSRSVQRNFRIIVISDTPSIRSDEYYNALYDLLLKAKNFSTSIDIVRVGDEKFYSDDVKLKVITSETYGGIFYCNHVKQFEDVLGSLVKSRKEFNIIRAKEEVLEKDRAFYEKLAADLISLAPDDEEICTICEQELCPICEAYSDEIHKCFNCDAKYHSCCITDYSLANNIGFKHILRCPQCETLLKLDFDFVNMVYEERYKEEEFEDIKEIKETVVEEKFIEEIEEEKMEGYTEDILVESPESVEIPEESSLDESTPFQDIKKVKIGGFFGKEITIGLKESKERPPITPQMFTPVVKSPKTSKVEEEKKSITNLKPPKRKSVNICKICGELCGERTKCPNCGSIIK